MENQALLRYEETKDGFNVIIDERWAAFFPLSSMAQVEFLVEMTNRALKDRQTK